MQSVLITGVAGQDGSCLAEFMLDAGHLEQDPVDGRYFSPDDAAILGELWNAQESGSSRVREDQARARLHERTVAYR